MISARSVGLLCVVGTAFAFGSRAFSDGTAAPAQVPRSGDYQGVRNQKEIQFWPTYPQADASK